tara:strand:+ start:872 stop:1222 length:351 start_codon:yes stop_codon:yes gene_type:complete
MKLYSYSGNRLITKKNFLLVANELQVKFLKKRCFKMSWKKELKKEEEDWRLTAQDSGHFKPKKNAIPNELLSKVEYLIETKEKRDLTEEEMELLKKAIEIYDTYVNHMGPLIDKLR